MRKLFTCFAAMLIALVANAAVINITPTSPQPADNLRLALNGAADGDIIEMAAGTYVESPSDYIAFTGKNVTVRAAEGAEVILQPQVAIRLKEGATAKFVGIKFDCGHLSDVNSYENLIVPADDTEGKSVILEGCELYNWTQVAAIIRSSTSRRLSNITIDKCYFHDVMKSCLFLENTNEAVVEITNSTFANIMTSSSYSAGVIDIRATAGSLLVDHCTFYNVEAMNTDYAAVGKVKLTSGAVVSNCIFAMPVAAQSTIRTIRDVVAANNCLVYNYTADSGWGMQSNVTRNEGCIKDQDPLFADAASGDYTLGAGSPALGAGTDGSNLGDPRWWPAAPAGCDWDNLEWLGDGSAEQTFGNQFKVCKAGAQPNVVNIQTAPWANNNTGIYINFPDAVIGNISLAEGQYKIEGAGILLFLSAFTAKETEVTVEWQNGVYEFTVFNAKGIATGIENNAVVEKAVKFIENGQLYIIKNGVKYNAQGAVVR